MAEQKWVLPVLIVLVAILVFNSFPAGQKMLGNIVGGFATTPADEVKETKDTERPFCEHDGITVTMGPVKKMFAPTTDITNEYHRLYIGQVDDGLKSDGSTKALTPFKDITVIYGENSSTYYASRADIKLPCDATLSTSEKDNDLFKLYQMDTAATLNLKCFNNGDGLKNTASNNETIGAGYNKPQDCSIEGTHEDAFSPYGGIYATVIYNTTAYDEVILTATTPGWNTDRNKGTPTFRTNANSSSGRVFKTVYFTKSNAPDGRTGLIGSEKISFSMNIDADDTVDPSGPGVGSQIHIIVDDEDYWRHTDDGDMKFGPENNDDVDVGSTQTKSMVFYIQ